MWTSLGAIILLRQGVIREQAVRGKEVSSEQVEPKVPVGQPGELSISFLPSGHQTLSTAHESGTGDIQVSPVISLVLETHFSPRNISEITMHFLMDDTLQL